MDERSFTRRTFIQVGAKIGAAVALSSMLTACDGNTSSGSIDFWRGKTIKIIVPHGAGGGYDAYARMVAPFLQKNMPGVKAIIIENKTGAGGTVGRNELYLAKPDGLTIGLTSITACMLAEIAGDAAVRYQCENWGYIAKVLGDQPVLMTSSTHPTIKTIDDVINFKGPVKLGTSGIATENYYNAILHAFAFGFDVIPVTGYAGSAEASLSVLRGEVDIFEASYTTVMPLVRSGDGVPLYVCGPNRRAIWPDVPTVFEIINSLTGATGGGSRLIVELLDHMTSLNRMFLAPPGMKPEILASWQEIMETTLTDSELLSSAESAGRPIEYQNGAESELIVKEVFTHSEFLHTYLRSALDLGQ